MFARNLNKKVDFRFNPRIGIEAHNVRQPSLVDSFYTEKRDSPFDDSPSIAVKNPLYMLFNQQRLDRLGQESLLKWIQSMNAAGHSNLAELRKKCSDEDLMAIVKSRHIQAPSELASWIDMLSQRAELFNSEVARIVAERKQAEEQGVIDNAESMVESQMK